VVGNGFAGGFIVAAAAGCGQTIGGRGASVSFAALVEPFPPRSGARARPICCRHGPLDCLHASRPL